MAIKLQTQRQAAATVARLADLCQRSHPSAKLPRKRGSRLFFGTLRSNVGNQRRNEIKTLRVLVIDTVMGLVAHCRLAWLGTFDHLLVIENQHIRHHAAGVDTDGPELTLEYGLCFFRLGLYFDTG